MEIKCGYLCSGNINIFDRAVVIRRTHRVADVCLISLWHSEE